MKITKKLLTKIIIEQRLQDDQFNNFRKLGIQVDNQPHNSASISSAIERGRLYFGDITKELVKDVAILKFIEKSGNIFSFEILNAKTKKRKGKIDILRGNLKYLRPIYGMINEQISGINPNVTHSYIGYVKNEIINSKNNFWNRWKNNSIKNLKKLIPSDLYKASLGWNISTGDWDVIFTSGNLPIKQYTWETDNGEIITEFLNNIKIMSLEDLIIYILKSNKTFQLFIDY